MEWHTKIEMMIEFSFRNQARRLSQLLELSTNSLVKLENIYQILCFTLFIYFILLYSFICCNIANSFFCFILFIFVIIVWQENVGYCSTLTKAHVLKEGKKNIFGGKKWLKLLHTYRKRRPYIERENHSDFSKRRGNKRKESGFPSTDWVFGRLIQIYKIKKRRIAKRKKRK